jgi:hypothetical protein
LLLKYQLAAGMAVNSGMLTPVLLHGGAAIYFEFMGATVQNILVQHV